MRVLGIDPGLTRCGVGVVEGQLGRPLRLVEAGVVKTPATAEHSQRLLSIDQGLAEWIDKYQPDVIAVERVFADQNVLSVVGTAQAAGLAMVNAARRGIPVHTHTPTEVKAAITGSGRADKAQVSHMVVRILKLAVAPKPADAADAVALAICHLWRGAANDRIAEALAKQMGKTA
ncbi:MAG: crossover junction endodeoxyribonuclease RuvC [Propionibacteriaceae bacterium]|jgi:crossover junction endodeoxyribonuclease RuvC|nr:crossover junction endodeoxyribonuclease RuvC [Propionibacteriaceae bacterium]